MNPRLVEPGFAVACLHAVVPARPGKDENGDDDAQAQRRHGMGNRRRELGRRASASRQDLATHRSGRATRGP
jgi:hypothetical protein